MRASVLALAAAFLVPACSGGGQDTQSGPAGGTGGTAETGGAGGAGGSTAGEGGGGAGGTGQPQEHAWPEPTLKIPGATKPAIAVTPGGTVLLAYSLGQKLWLQRDPAGSSSPEMLEEQVGDGIDVRGVTDPSSEQAYFIDGNLSAWWVDGATTTPTSYQVSSWWSTTSLSVSWTSDRPIVAMRSNHDNSEYWVHVWQAPPEGGAALPTPDETTLLGTEMFAAQLYDEAPSFLPLGGGAGITVFSQPGYTAEDPYGRYARWLKVQRDPSRTAEEGAYYLPGATGMLELPIPQGNNASWVAIHAAGGGAVLTWHMVPECACQVNDVYMQRVAFDAGGVPSLVGDAVNVSGTSGQTDESDSPVVRATSADKLWVAWRESAFGPRVALYDMSLQREWVGAPSADSACDLTQPISAAADSAGVLWVAAVMRPAGEPQVWLWRIE